MHAWKASNIQFFVSSFSVAVGWGLVTDYSLSIKPPISEQYIVSRQSSLASGCGHTVGGGGISNNSLQCNARTNKYPQLKLPVLRSAYLLICIQTCNKTCFYAIKLSCLIIIIHVMNRRKEQYEEKLPLRHHITLHNTKQLFNHKTSFLGMKLTLKTACGTIPPTAAAAACPQWNFTLCCQSLLHS